MIQIDKAIQQGMAALSMSPSARMDAEILLAFVLNKNRAYLYAHSDATLTADQSRHFEETIEKRKTGIPIAYLVGSRDFWSLSLKVTPDTLIPRPETELLIELSLSFFDEKKTMTVLDLGTGSGAIALALGSERPNWKIIAVDSSNQALEVAKENKNRLGLKNIDFYLSNWFDDISFEQFDLIVSNPPYISKSDEHLNQGDLRFEPLQALVSPDEGLRDIQHIIKKGLDWLKPGGLLLLEHGFEQKPQVASMLNNYGYYQIESYQDIQGHDRVSSGRRISVE